MASLRNPPDTQLRSGQIDHALDLLRSPADGAAGISEAVLLGVSIVPSLRAILFAREPSGLYHARRRAAEALGVLKAFDVLAEFLRLERAISDPVESLGEDVVLSAVARSIARLREDWVYCVLRDLAARKTLNGVLAGLGSFEREDSIPIFVAALAEDEVRLTAEAILRRFGTAAKEALLNAAMDPGLSDEGQSESQLRKRRSALGLLIAISCIEKSRRLSDP